MHCKVVEILEITMSSRGLTHLRRLVVSLSVLSLSLPYSITRLCFGLSSESDERGLTAPNCEVRDLVLRNRCRI